MQIDEIDIVVIFVCSGNGSNRKKTSPAAETSEGLLLMFNITDEIGTLVRWMNLVATSEAVAIQLCHDQITGRLRRQVIVQQRRISRDFDSSNIAIASVGIPAFQS